MTVYHDGVPDSSGVLLADVAAIKAETDKIPAVKAETDKVAGLITTVSSIKTETDKVAGLVTTAGAIKTETDKIPGVKTETDKIAGLITTAGAIKTETDKIAGLVTTAGAIKTETDKIAGQVTRVGDPDAHTLKSLVAKFGDLARDLDTVLGSRWDSTGDVGTDIASLIAYLTIATKDEATNTHSRHAIGNKEDAAVTAAGTENSAMAYLKGLLTILGVPARDLDTILGTRWDSAGDLGTDIAALLGDLGDADAHTLKSVIAKIGDLAVSLDTLLGARWDSSGDLGTDVATLIAQTAPTAAGRTQFITKQITSAANAGDVTLATINTKACQVESIVVRSNGATTEDLTSVKVIGGASGVLVFISDVEGARANIAAKDQQVAWTGARTLGATGTIVMNLAGNDTTPVDLQVDIKYRAVEAGGYLT